YRLSLYSMRLFIRISPSECSVEVSGAVHDPAGQGLGVRRVDDVFELGHVRVRLDRRRIADPAPDLIDGLAESALDLVLVDAVVTVAARAAEIDEGLG